VIVDYRAGAGGNLGTELVAKSALDGYTILNVRTAQVISQSLYAKLDYNLERDLAPAVLQAYTPPAATAPSAIFPVKC
jgi:tripartite-type tricarboxylate transporter receptor subunit TctC